ncbi:MAG: FtsW/RodA/SpoVE family cell cycle protein [Actinomycetaceae bacterium]|nr:FtsW/RodA/SpoVE family cell cycle protein [Actinomycetaceae bacterium]
MNDLHVVKHSDDEIRNAMQLAILVLVSITCLLLIIGVVMVYSAVSPSAIRYGSFEKAHTQLIYGLLAVCVVVAFALVPFRWYRTKIMALGFFILALFLQALVFIPALSVSVGGNTNWVNLKFFSLQPSEFLKLGLIMAISYIFFRHPLEKNKKKRFGYAGAATIVALGVLLVGTGDMGTALVFFAFLVGMFVLGGVSIPRKYMIPGFGLAGIGVVLLLLIGNSRIERIKLWKENFFSTPRTMQPTQVDYSLWAFGSGGIGGTGLGSGVEKWPGSMAEAQTDFIFAVIGEELGLFGSLIVVLAFVTFGWSCMHIVRYHPDNFARYLVSGIGLWIVVQAVFNMLVVTGLLPVFGVTLPFISQGGSSLLANAMAVGVVMACALSPRGVKESLVAHIPGLLKK